MRWALAALAFGLLVSLAVATVATRACNLQKRLRLKQIDHHVVTHSIERARWLEWLRDEVTPKGLAHRLHRWVGNSAPQ